MKSPQPIPCCPPKPKLDERPLISPEQAAGLMDLFKVFANDTRLRLLHALARSGELCVGELADAVAMKPQAVSNQLQRLVDWGILGSRRDGTSIWY
jgi:DNA-binding transcriptional ArsR family regulator